MFTKIRQWLASNRDWNARHRESWAGADAPDRDGLSRFQRQCERELESALRSFGVTLKDRRESPAGTEANIFARLGDTPLSVWIYTDGAEVAGEGVDRRFEEWDALTPDDLITAFVAVAVREVQPFVAREV